MFTNYVYFSSSPGPVEPPETVQDIAPTLQQLLVPQDAAPALTQSPAAPMSEDLDRGHGGGLAPADPATVHIGSEERHAYHWNLRPQDLYVPWELRSRPSGRNGCLPPSTPTFTGPRASMFGCGRTSRELGTDLGRGSRLLFNIYYSPTYPYIRPISCKLVRS